MEYVESLIWFSLWPIVIYASYKFVFRNIKRFEQSDKSLLDEDYN